MKVSQCLGSIFATYIAAGVSSGNAISLTENQEVSVKANVDQGRTFSENDSRFVQIVNYDDEKVDSIPYWTKDYQYVRPSEGGKFYPDSASHVPRKNPIQEQYLGVHKKENELFRVDEKTKEEDNMGVRVASGVQVDETEKQYQAHGPNPSKINTTGTIPLCRYYKNSMPTMNEWNGTDKWIIASDLGIQRITLEELSPISKPANLFLRDHACNAATISANVRMSPNTIAGVVFRAESDSEKYAVLLDSTRRVASLTHFAEGKPLTISEVYVSYLFPEMRHKIEIVDHGANGHITIFLDGRSVFTNTIPFLGIGNMGILIERGHAAFDSFTVSP